MAERTTNGKAFRILNIIDEFTRETCLVTRVGRKISSQDVIDELFKLFILRGIPEHIHSDNGPGLQPKQRGNGGPDRSETLLSKKAAPGRTVTSSPLTVRCEMNY